MTEEQAAKPRQIWRASWPWLAILAGGMVGVTYVMKPKPAVAHIKPVFMPPPEIAAAMNAQGSTQMPTAAEIRATDAGQSAVASTTLNIAPPPPMVTGGSSGSTAEAAVVAEPTATNGVLNLTFQYLSNYRYDPPGAPGAPGSSPAGSPAAGSSAGGSAGNTGADQSVTGNISTSAPGLAGSGGAAAETNASGPAAKPNAQIPAKIMALNGKKVAVQGFMIPLDMDSGKTKMFAMVAVIPGCFYCQPPGLNEYVVVTMKDGQAVDYPGPTPVRVTGEFAVGEVREGDMVTSIYRMTGESVGDAVEESKGQF